MKESRLKIVWVNDNRADGRTARQWYADQYADLRDHAAVFSSTWTYCGVRTLIEKSRDQHDRKILHLYHARNSVNAAADGRLFRTILSVSY